ncbi:ISLre2 family transposase [Halanaerobium sp. Z-7514]|uniref:ISLre2 family transposase n=1 Tax=Halanaerobium polyolivorans TaxID=2886943 RepID=A0AAW4X2P3_9FIRM|nr:ISLre2 family transposase [Halanaerobium polyolivorans]MCC3146072.1 ISLre2 family transposase [Halanaerobium polyolivorans]
MNNIIQDFAENFSSNIEKYIKELFEGKKGGISGLIEIIDKDLNGLGRDLLVYVLENMDEEIRESKERKKLFNIQARDMDKSLVTKFGKIKYQRTYYVSKSSEDEDEEYTYLVDDVFGIERHQKIEEGIEVDLVEKAKEYSYQAAADIASEVVPLTRQTTLNKIKKLGKIDNRAIDDNKSKEKKKVKHLYIEADEDHVSIQKRNCTKSKKKKKSSQVTKLVYVHEGRKGKRNKLENAKYFSGIYPKSEDLWEEVLSYIDENYDLDYIDTIFLSGDGGAWIKKGLKEIHKTKYILDRYHLNKYVLLATGHCPKQKFDLWLGLNRADYNFVSSTFKEIYEKAENEEHQQRVKKARKYIYSNWHGINNYVNDQHAEGCSAEGHVSHVLASRMSSRPLSWSEDGADRMARLRAFKYNGGEKEDLYKLFKIKEKEKRIKMRTEKIIDHRKTLFPLAKETVPALRKGKVNGLSRAIKALAF